MLAAEFNRYARVSVCFAAVGLLGANASAQFVRTDLVSNQAGAAPHQDANLVNGWGVAFNPSGVAWVSAADGHVSTLYDGAGAVQSLVVNIPTPSAATGGSPTGIVYSGGSDFLLNGAPSRFMFATEDGTIAAWNGAAGTQAANMIDRSGAGAHYTGLGLASTAGGSRLYAADFHNGHVDTFDGTFSPVTATFTDPALPAGYAPFNVRAFGDRVFVTYAVVDPATGEELAGPGNGIVDVFNTDGSFASRLATGGALNAPWGMAMAPANFGALSNALLVGNFGDGLIHAFDPVTGAMIGTLSDASNAPIVIDGLWGMDFGNGGVNQATNALFFAAGPDDEANGLFGRIDLVPSPGAAGVLTLAALAGFRRRR